MLDEGRFFLVQSHKVPTHEQGEGDSKKREPGKVDK